MGRVLNISSLSNMGAKLTRHRAQKLASEQGGSEPWLLSTNAEHTGGSGSGPILCADKEQLLIARVTEGRHNPPDNNIAATMKMSQL